MRIVFINILMTGILSLGMFFAEKYSATVYVMVLLICVTAAIEGIFCLAISKVMAKAASYTTLTFGDIIREIGKNWTHGMLFGLIGLFAGGIAYFSISYYLSFKSIAGLGAAALIFWISIIFFLAFQWFLPIRSQVDAFFLKSVKKSFVVFFDNVGFSIFMCVILAGALYLSSILYWLIPGIGVLILFQNEAFRLRLYKYEWLERQTELDPKEARKAVPWGELISKDYEITGNRTLRDLLFPWKY